MKKAKTKPRRKENVLCVFVENVFMLTSNGISSYVEGILILAMEIQGEENVLNKTSLG